MPLDVEPVALVGHWYRHAYHGSGPVARRDPPPDNRWQRGDVVEALYLADDPATVWAEWYRHHRDDHLTPLRER